MKSTLMQTKNENDSMEMVHGADEAHLVNMLKKSEKRLEKLYTTVKT
jgi:hypothetical protein